MIPAHRLAAQLEGGARPADVEPALDLDVPQLRYALSQIAADVRTPAQRGVQVAGFTVPPQPGVDVDVEMTLEAGGAVGRRSQRGAGDRRAGCGAASRRLSSKRRPPAQMLALTPLILRDARFCYELL